MSKELTKEEIAKQVYPDVEGYLDQVEHDRIQFIRGLEYSDQNTKPLKDEIAKLKASKLEILNHIKSGFEVQSDYSTQCNGYKYLCREVEQLKASKSEANEAVESQEDILRELISLIQTSLSVGIIMQKFTITRNNN